jgi:hypothetical protein
MPPTIGWDESLPSDSESAGLGDDRIRSLKTSLRIGLDGEHVWPSGGGDVGVHRLGSARPYYGAQSLVSSTGTDGRLMVTSDTSRLFHVGSAGTLFLGGANVLSVGSDPPGGQRFYWAHEIGEVLITGTSQVVTYPNSGFSGIPFTLLSIFTTRTNPMTAHLTTRSPTQFTVRGYIADSGSAASNYTLMWASIGTRSF